jgi:hypothetical protein
MKLPEGVLFSSGRQCAFGGLKVKGETLASNDWIERDLLDVDPPQIDSTGGRPDYKDIFQTLDEMLLAGTSHPLNTSYGRDGRFDDEDVFLVFERPDLLELQRVIAKALEGPNEIE